MEYSGFDELEQHTIITADGFDSYDEILTIGDSYIVNLANIFSDRNVVAGKIISDLYRTNLLKATIHWAQDFRRISQTPPLIGIRNAAEFCTIVEAESKRARIKNHSLEESARLSKYSDPGNLKLHKDWIIFF